MTAKVRRDSFRIGINVHGAKGRGKRAVATSTTTTGDSFDEKTGEVRARQPIQRRRTPEEQAEAKRVRDERAELRRAEVAALRAIDPACETEADPPVVWRPSVRMGGDPSGVLLDIPRVSGRGRAGSRLVLAARRYDGAGPNGGQAHEYVSAFATYYDGAGYRRRSVGVAIHRGELREVAAALSQYADELDAKEGP